jgi:acetyltransferase-like isoleucine patch superfamily enzyme
MTRDRPVYVHPSADVEDGATVGDGTRIWHRSHVRSGSTIGGSCNLGLAVYVDDGVRIGDRCKIANHVSVFRGVTIEDDVFVGPSVVFTNDRFPRADAGLWELVPTLVRRGASIGANATVVCGVVLGPWSMVGAGSVVTSDVPAYGLVVGVPARLRGWVCICGRPLGGLASTLPEACRVCGRRTSELVTAS